MLELVHHIERMKGYFLDDKRIIRFVSKRPGNSDIAVIDEKVALLIGRAHVDFEVRESVCQSIRKLNIDQMLAEGKASVVSMIAGENHPIPDALHFASLYCAAHQPWLYPIYNGYSSRIVASFTGQPFIDQDYYDYWQQAHQLKAICKMQALNFFDINKLFWIYQDQLMFSFNSNLNRNEATLRNQYNHSFVNNESPDIGTKTI